MSEGTGIDSEKRALRDQARTWELILKIATKRAHPLHYVCNWRYLCTLRHGKNAMAEGRNFFLLS